MASNDLTRKSGYDSYHSRGCSTLKVDPALFRTNRDRLIDSLRKVKALENKKNPLVLLKGGEYTMRYCSDHEPIFRQESYFHWTFGVREPDFYGVINVETGKSYLFAPKLPQEYAVWMGELLKPGDFKAHYQVDDVYWVEDVKKVLKQQNSDVLLTLYGINSDSGSYSKPATFDGINEFNVDRDILHPVISELRVFKTDLELEVLRYVCKVSSEAHKEVMKRIKPKMKEYQLESIFQFFCSYYGGARFMAYTCICGSGKNSSVLHYGHSGEPNNKKMDDGDLCLLDMGCEYFCYASDITCSYPCNGKYSDQQKVVYNSVLEANLAVREALKPGVSWVDMHILAERKILESLKKAGLLIGDVDEMVENRLGAVFMPHGLGHFIGIDTHDVGGYLPGHPARSDKPGLKSLRTSRTMQERMCITIEPGCYFINALLEKAFKDEKLSKFLVKSEIDKYVNIGGVRIEDCVYVTKDGIEILSKVPRTIEEIEALIQKGREEKHIHFPELDLMNGSESKCCHK